MEKLKKLKSIIQNEVEFLNSRGEGDYRNGNLDFANFVLRYIQLLEEEVEEVQE